MSQGDHGSGVRIAGRHEVEALHRAGVGPIHPEAAGGQVQRPEHLDVALHLGLIGVGVPPDQRTQRPRRGEGGVAREVVVALHQIQRVRCGEEGEGQALGALRGRADQDVDNRGVDAGHVEHRRPPGLHEVLPRRSSSRGAGWSRGSPCRRSPERNQARAASVGASPAAPRHRTTRPDRRTAPKSSRAVGRAGRPPRPSGRGGARHRFGRRRSLRAAPAPRCRCRGPVRGSPPRARHPECRPTWVGPSSSRAA